MGGNMKSVELFNELKLKRNIRFLEFKTHEIHQLITMNRISQSMMRSWLQDWHQSQMQNLPFIFFCK